MEDAAKKRKEKRVWIAVISTVAILGLVALILVILLFPSFDIEEKKKVTDGTKGGPANANERVESSPGSLSQARGASLTSGHNGACEIPDRNRAEHGGPESQSSHNGKKGVSVEQGITIGEHGATQGGNHEVKGQKHLKGAQPRTPVGPDGTEELQGFPSESGRT